MGKPGLATFMHVIEHEMLARGAPHGKVLPLTAAHAKTYEGFRRNIENDYGDVIAISTAAGKGESMSDDTGIQEMLLVGTKRKKEGGSKVTARSCASIWSKILTRNSRSEDVCGCHTARGRTRKTVWRDYCRARGWNLQPNGRS